MTSVRILIYTDFSWQTQQTLSWIRLRLPDARLRLLHVVDVASLWDHRLTALSPHRLALRIARQTLTARQTLKTLVRSGHERPEVRWGNPARVVVQVAQAWPADIIMVAPPQHNWLAAWSYPSMAFEVMQLSSIPVVVLKQSDLPLHLSLQS